MKSQFTLRSSPPPTLFKHVVDMVEGAHELEHEHEVHCSSHAPAQPTSGPPHLQHEHAGPWQHPHAFRGAINLPLPTPAPPLSWSELKLVQAQSIFIV